MRPQPRPDRGPQRVEGLGEDQAEVRTLLGPQFGHQRIGGDLQQGDARGDDEQGHQDARIEVEEGGDRHDQTTQHHGQQGGDDAPAVAQTRHRRCGRQRSHAIGDEPGKGGQKGLGIAEVEHPPHRRDQRIDQRGGEAPGEKQTGDIGEGEARAARRRAGLRLAHDRFPLNRDEARRWSDCLDRTARRPEAAPAVPKS
ncbi:hypothetical protein D3C86_1386640 [compost metagenome]